MEYSDYLKSDAWNARRRMKLKEASFRCQLCNAGKCELHVHHRTYANLDDEHPADLVVLCADCHEWFHHRDERTELTSEDFTQAIYDLHRAKQPAKFISGIIRLPLDTVQLVIARFIETEKQIEGAA